MKKKMLAPKRRAVILAVLLLLTAAEAAGSWYAFRLPLEEKKKEVVTEYRQEASLGYRAHLKPNPYYRSETMPLDSLFLAPLTQQLELFCNYRFTSAKELKVGATSILTAEVTVKDRPRNEERILWSREEVLIPQKSLTGEGTVKGKEVKSAERVLLDWTRYRDLASTFLQEAGATGAEATLTVKWRVWADVSSPVARNRETIEATLIFPLNERVVEAKGEPAMIKQGALTSEKTVSHPERRWYRIGAIAFFILTALGTIAFGLLTEGIPAPAQEIARRKIYRKYGDYIVEGTGAEGEPFTRLVEVNSFPDLVKVADELGKPILHFGDGEEVFRVVDGDTCYQYWLRDEREETKTSSVAEKKEIPL